MNQENTRILKVKLKNTNSFCKDKVQKELQLDSFKLPFKIQDKKEIALEWVQLNKLHTKTK